jgi:hypothetical protein
MWHILAVTWAATSLRHPAAARIYSAVHAAYTFGAAGGYIRPPALVPLFMRRS